MSNQPDLRASMYERAYFDVQKVLDEYLGSEEEDGAGGGIAGDVWLMGERMRTAELEVQRLQRQLKHEIHGEHYDHKDDDRGPCACITAEQRVTLRAANRANPDGPHWRSPRCSVHPDGGAQ